MAKKIMVLGTGSHVGKSIVTTAICRVLSDKGLKVCPFKSQNMALNSFITSDGHEIGRSQAVQAFAARVEPQAYMNPILLKPTTDTKAQVIFMGRPLKNMDARTYHDTKKMFVKKIKSVLKEMDKEYDAIVIEGAGSPSEINLLENDIVNLKTAQIANSPVILVGDIDTGGIFASFYGTIKILPKKYRKYFKGLLINKFRGDAALLKDGIDWLEKKLKIPVLGTMPFYRDIEIEQEDSVWLEKSENPKGKALEDAIKVAVIMLPRISNFTDFDILKNDSSFALSFVRDRKNLSQLDPDIIVIPGTKSTIKDMLFLKESDIQEEIIRQSEKKVVIGICGGYQMLCRKIKDPYHVECPDISEIDGLGLFDMETGFRQKKDTYQSLFIFHEGLAQKYPLLQNILDKKRCVNNQEMPAMSGYEIHMGKTTGCASALFHTIKRNGKSTDMDDGAVSFRKNGIILGTYMHGVFDNISFRNFLINLVQLKTKDKGKRIKQGIVSYEDFRQSQYDALAQLFCKNIDCDTLLKIMDEGV